MMKNPTQILAEGIVLENLPNAQFRVRILAGEIAEKVILCHLSGKMRISYIRLLPGDKVRCEISTLDTSKGRILNKIKY